MYRGLRVAVVIPAHNEARLLPVTLSGLPAFVDAIVVVDDASTDATVRAARTAAAPVAPEIIRHAENLGVGGAIVTGYRRALHLGVDAAVVVGADAQMDPSEMHRLLDPLVEGRADYVKGDRMGHPEVRQRMPWVRYVGNRALTRLTRMACGASIRDAQCGYTAITTEVLARLPLDVLYPRYGFPNDLLARLAEIDARILDRPVSPIYGDEASGIRVLRVVVPISMLLMRAAWRRRWRRRPALPAPVRELS